jgi:deazaflavin-dependent oxidoreductase (nitroreductase family)
MTSYIRPGVLLTHVANPILRHLAPFPALIVRGRRSGKLLTVPMGEPLDLDGRRYLVSGRGETHWVRNLRAAGHATFRARGRTTAFTATELVDADREAVVAAYRRKLGRRVDPCFSQIPDARSHPVFRMDPPLPEPTAGRETPRR